MAGGAAFGPQPLQRPIKTINDKAAGFIIHYLHVLFRRNGAGPAHDGPAFRFRPRRLALAGKAASGVFGLRLGILPVRFGRSPPLIAFAFRGGEPGTHMVKTPEQQGKRQNQRQNRPRFHGRAPEGLIPGPHPART